MTSYTLSIGGTVPVSCWIKPSGAEYEVFCNAPNGFDSLAHDAGGKIERAILGGERPIHENIDLAPLLHPGETVLTIRARP